MPQADDVKKIQEFPFRVSEGMDNSAQIADYFEFDPRQSSYYREATESLGLVELHGNKYHLTDIGKEYVRLPVQKRNELLARLMFELPVMHEVLMELLIKPSKRVSSHEITEIIASSSHLGGTTPARRMRTILKWFTWIQNSVGVLRVDSSGLSV